MGAALRHINSGLTRVAITEDERARCRKRRYQQAEQGLAEGKTRPHRAIVHGVIFQKAFFAVQTDNSQTRRDRAFVGRKDGTDQMVWIMTQVSAVEPEVALGLVLVAASAGRPFGLAVSHLALGDTRYALARIAILQLSRIVTIPISLGLVLPFGMAELPQAIVLLRVYIFLPLVIGLAL